MTDAEIPKICRDCKHCQRYHEISDWMPRWLPWKYNCDAVKSGTAKQWSYEHNDYICLKKE